ncbi:MAG: type II toxin-antitoxin system HicB family antitoxin [Methanothrix sp.]|jgi:predicted RNase H-like HicB family nuclease|uniref:HicB-like antitoxin of toxin-antitoxin system domain-containing protein n=1 Tax=Methanothrix harundinacea TaxID=301375 RepID=A0A124G3M8_9EURY|nr:MAG: hypothetical protein XE07_0266 [Methanothrix harundinacea]MDD3709365.1 type II toxin-antitoxin system HicB family antitoxin [Methanothrix sp.]
MWREIISDWCRWRSKSCTCPFIEIYEDGYYIASCPQFKGCHSYGETVDEALENIREVVEMCLEEIVAVRIETHDVFE